MASGCCTVLADLSALDIPYARFGVAGLGSCVKANSETAQKVLAAFVEGIHYYKTYPDAGVAAPRAEEPTRKGRGRSIRKSPILTGAGPIRIFRSTGVLDSLPEERAKKVRPESLIDPVPGERVAKSGLLEKLYGKKESAS